jgi:hypothetical protein
MRTGDQDYLWAYTGYTWNDQNALVSTISFRIRITLGDGAETLSGTFKAVLWISTGILSASSAASLKERSPASAYRRWRIARCGHVDVPTLPLPGSILAVGAAE